MRVYIQFLSTLITSFGLLVSVSSMLAVLNVQLALAQDPPPPIVVVYQEVPTLPTWIAGAGEYVATTQQEFSTLLTQYKQDSNFLGTIIITDDFDSQAWPPVCQGKVHLRLRFRDIDYYNSTWEPLLDQGWVPGFLQEQEAVPAPSIEDTLYDIDVWWKTSSRYASLAEMRVRKVDGDIGMVNARTVMAICSAPPASLSASSEGCEGAGPWWPTCCSIQRSICRSGGWVIGCFFHPGRCLDCMSDGCEGCYQSCVNCSVGDPCHSCDPCGLTWILCRWFGHC